MSEIQGNILIIEDDEDTRELLDFILGRAGFQTRLAFNGQDAMDMVESTIPPDLVLLDILMPYHDGFEVLHCIKDKPDWQGVPVLMLTSKDNEEDIVKGFREGITDYIVKPFKPAELVARLQHAIEQRK